ncbi:MAG: hypothetical protein Q8L14_09580 [Myxococcales bacterium]|nr:hypothetical protein [Myxococcales bacterium]
MADVEPKKLSTKLALEFLEHQTFAHLTSLRGITRAIVAGLRPIERQRGIPVEH